MWHSTRTCATNQISRSSIISSFHTILTNRKNNFLHGLLIFIIISHKHQFIIITQFIISTVNDFISIKLCIFKISRTCINLCIQIYSCSQQPIGSFISTSKRSLPRFVHIGYTFIQFFLNKIIQIFSTLFYRKLIIKMFFEWSLTK